MRLHLVQKLLLRELAQGSVGAPDSLAVLLDMQMPDEQGTQLAKARAVLAAYLETHGIAPSLEQLHLVVFPKLPRQPRTLPEEARQLPG